MAGYDGFVNRLTVGWIDGYMPIFMDGMDGCIDRMDEMDGMDR